MTEENKTPETDKPAEANDDFPLGKACSNQDEECEACQ